MKARTVLGVLALGLGLMSWPNDAEARSRHRSYSRHRHSGVRIGFGVNIAPYYRAQPIYGDVDWDYESNGGYYDRYSDRYYDDGYYSDSYYDGGYGYSRYYRSPYVGRAYRRAPRVVVHYQGSRRYSRPHRYTRFRR